MIDYIIVLLNIYYINYLIQLKLKSFLFCKLAIWTLINCCNYVFKQRTKLNNILPYLIKGMIN